MYALNRACIIFAKHRKGVLVALQQLHQLQTASSN
jgi:hypothetical protein